MATQGIRSPAANTQPIYPREPLVWHGNLTTHATGFNPMADPLLSPPVLLGSGGDNGALIEHFSWNSIYEAPSGGGGSGGSGGGGGLPVDGPLGLRTPGDENYFRFYSRRFGTTELQFMLEIFIPSGSRFGVQRWLYFPILPDPQVGLRLAPDEELYVGLKYKAPAPGIIVSLRGGYY